MSTENMPEDEIDDLFRRAASGYHPEFDPKAWQAMEKKLDAQAGATASAAKTNWWRLGGLVLFILFTGIGVWIGYNQLNQNREVTETKQPVVAAQKEPETLENNPTRESGAENIAQPNNQPGQTIAQNNIEIAPDQNQPVGPINGSELTDSQREKHTPKAQIAGFSGKQANQNRVSNLNITQRATIVEDKAKKGNTAAAAKISNQLKPETKTTTASSNIAVPTPDSVVNKIAEAKISETNKPVIPDSSLATTNPAPSPSDSAEAKKNRNILALNRFTISIMAAPDLSTVGFANPGGISTNAGFILGYNLNSKWSLTTGMVRARKIYDAKPDDYGSKNYWYNRHKPNDISAVCQVLDIPVNIGYNVWQKNKSVFTVQSGLSSYIMKEEEYTYKYLPYGGGSGYNSYYEVKNKNRHLFSMYNLSGYYGRSLSPGITAGVAPFVKVPLAGVGAGKVKLASAGIFFSLSYRYPQ